MTYRPDLSDREEGDIVVIDGRSMRHLGGGRFVPAEMDILKRFDINDDEPLHRVA